MAVEITHRERSAAGLRHEAARAKDAKASRRMLALALVLDGHSRLEAARSCGMDRQTLRDWVHRYNAQGLEGLADRALPGRTPMLGAEQMNELAAIVEKGPDPQTDGVVRWRRIDLCEVVERRFGVRVAERTMGAILHPARLRQALGAAAPPAKRQPGPGAIQKTSSPSHARRCLRRRRASRWRSGSKSEPGQKTVRGTVFPANARVGQQGTLTRLWARKGTRPRAPKDCRYASAYLFGAICPARATGAALVMPHANTEAMSLHLAEIARTVAPEAHALLVLDGAGWHSAKNLVVPPNITLPALPPYSPELSPVENVWQFLRQNRLANRLFDSHDAIVDAWLARRGTRSWRSQSASPPSPCATGHRSANNAVGMIAHSCGSVAHGFAFAGERRSPPRPSAARTRATISPPPSDHVRRASATLATGEDLDRALRRRGRAFLHAPP